MESPVRNFIAKALGILWLLDGLLQFQPQMFGQTFVTNILTPLLSDQPGFMVAIVNWGIQLWDTNTVMTNTAAALLQCAIGVLILFPLSSRRFKLGLWISIVWGVVVWICGEGAGLLLTGGASFYTGAPGAIVMYILLAVLLLIPEKVTTASYPKIAGWIFILGALLQLQPSLWTGDGAMGNFMTSMNDPMHFLNALPNYFANIATLHPVGTNVFLAAILFVVGLVILLKPNRTTGIIALAFLFFVWWLGQDLGQISTLFVGTMTDPNTAPLVALLLIPLFTGLGLAASPQNP